MAQPQLLLRDEICYGYHQILIFDATEDELASRWSDEHAGQGFVRRERMVAFNTLDPYGMAPLRVFAGGPGTLESYARAIAVCLVCPSGRLLIQGPEEAPYDRVVPAGPGPLEITCAQGKAGGRTFVDIFVRPVGQVGPSRILKADGRLNPPEALLEWADAL